MNYSRTVDLESGGTITLVANMDPFRALPADHGFVRDILEQMERYETAYKLAKGEEPKKGEPLAAPMTLDNRRDPKGDAVTFNGKTLSIWQWSKLTGIRHNTIYLRLKRGWPVERALTDKDTEAHEATAVAATPEAIQDRIVQLLSEGVAEGDLHKHMQVGSAMLTANMNAMRRLGVLEQFTKEEVASDEVAPVVSGHGSAALGKSENVSPGKEKAPVLTWSPEERKKRIREMFLAGRPKDEIARELDMSEQAVGCQVGIMRKAGLLPPRVQGVPDNQAEQAAAMNPTASHGEPSHAKDEQPDPEASVSTPDGKTEENAGEDEPEDDDSLGSSASSRDELTAEVRRQQGGSRADAHLITTMGRGHKHSARVDRFGDGNTVPDGSGHSHRVKGFLVMPAHNHAHELVAKAPAKDSGR